MMILPLWMITRQLYVLFLCVIGLQVRSVSHPAKQRCEEADGCHAHSNVADYIPSLLILEKLSQYLPRVEYRIAWQESAGVSRPPPALPFEQCRELKLTHPRGNGLGSRSPGSPVRVQLAMSPRGTWQ